MHDPDMEQLVEAAVEARRTRPALSAVEVLDLILRGIGPLALRSESIHPATRLGQLVAEAFDGATMTPAEWMDWAGEGSEASLHEALLVAWNTEVMPKFRARFGLAP